MSMAVVSSLHALARPSLLLLHPSHSTSSACISVSHATWGQRGSARLVARVAVVPADAEWLEQLLEKNKPLYMHNLPYIEVWLCSIGFMQSREDRTIWVAEMPLWHARLILDVNDLHIRYLNRGPRNLEKDFERRFSYALSREDIENAILGGP